MARHLIENLGVKVDSPPIHIRHNSFKNPYFICACSESNYETVKVFLENGANINDIGVICLQKRNIAGRVEVTNDYIATNGIGTAAISGNKDTLRILVENCDE